MTSMGMHPSRFLTVGLGLTLAWACTVADKGDYTFDDTPAAGATGGGGGSGGSAGKGGKGGSGGRGGSAGSGVGGSVAQAGEAGQGATAGEGGASAGGTGGKGGSGGGKGGSAGSSTGNPCDPDPCQHGTCSVDGDSYDCDCDRGWSGSRCQTNTDDCAPNPCQNGGSCADGIDAYTCTCTPGYTGDDCEIAPDSCDPDPCVNGDCVEVSGGISCTCDPGWSGDNCTTNIDECESDPCENGGTCRDGINSYACDCTGTGYTGTTCSDDIDECMTVMPCQHGGACTNNDGGYACDCTGTGFTGNDCEDDVNECDSSPCQHGGTCVNGDGTYSCSCTGTGYEGQNCENNVNDCSPNPCNSGTCADGVNDYTCTCPSGVLGDNCERYCGNGAADGATIDSVTLRYAALTCYGASELPLFLNGVPIHGLTLGGCDCYEAYERTLVVTDPTALAAVRPTGNVFEVRDPSLLTYTGYVRAEFALTGAANVQVTGIDGTGGPICVDYNYYPYYYDFPTQITRGSITGAAFNVPAVEACDGQSGCSQCGCPAGQVVCGNACRDVVTEEASCGSCSNVCSSGQTCGDGVCLGPTILNIPTSGLVSMEVYGYCSGAGEWDNGDDHTWGVTWTDPGTFTPSSVVIELGANWDCASGIPHNTTLNGVASGDFTLNQPGGCTCDPGVVINSWTLTDLSGYVRGGSNTMMATQPTATNTMSLLPHSSWPAGTYARVLLYR